MDTKKAASATEAALTKGSANNTKKIKIPKGQCAKVAAQLLVKPTFVSDALLRKESGHG